MQLADIRKLAHIQGYEMGGKIVSLVGMVGGNERIEKAKKVAVFNEADVAYSDLVIELAWTWFPQSMTMIQVSELLPIGIIVSVGHSEWGRERILDGRWPITLNIRSGKWRAPPAYTST